MAKKKAEDGLTDEEYLERFKIGNSEDFPVEEWKDMWDKWRQEDSEED